MTNDKPDPEPQDIPSEPGLIDQLLTRLSASITKLENQQSKQTEAQAIPDDVPCFVTRR